MSRICKAYETRFRWLLKRARARKLSQGVEWLSNKASRMSKREGIPLAAALTQVYEQLAATPRLKTKPEQAPELFFCDAGLGGLARWLRAAGYEALWEEGIDDAVLLTKTRQRSATLLTTDSMLMERRLLRDRIIPALWLPPTLSLGEQLAMVFREFGLQLRERRCMRCGGALWPADKAALKDRIPLRTYRWLDDYFLCSRCGHLFWHGTHWRNIRRQLEAAARGETRRIVEPKGV